MYRQLCERKFRRIIPDCQVSQTLASERDTDTFEDKVLSLKAIHIEKVNKKQEIRENVLKN